MGGPLTPGSVSGSVRGVTRRRRRRREEEEDDDDDDYDDDDDDDPVHKTGGSCNST